MYRYMIFSIFVLALLTGCTAKSEGDTIDRLMHESDQETIAISIDIPEPEEVLTEDKEPVEEVEKDQESDQDQNLVSEETVPVQSKSQILATAQEKEEGEGLESGQKTAPSGAIIAEEKPGSENKAQDGETKVTQQRGSSEPVGDLKFASKELSLACGNSIRTLPSFNTMALSGGIEEGIGWFGDEYGEDQAASIAYGEEWRALEASYHMADDASNGWIYGSETMQFVGVNEGQNVIALTRDYENGYYVFTYKVDISALTDEENAMYRDASALLLSVVTSAPSDVEEAIYNDCFVGSSGEDVMTVGDCIVSYVEAESDNFCSYIIKK